MTDNHSLPEGIDTTVPNSARMYNYSVGGKDNFAVDREAFDQLVAILPHGANPPLENRAFLGRAVRFLAEAGVRQYLDLGSGLPTHGNVHEVAQAIIPDARVVYVDYDPVAVSHAEALLATSANVASIQADIREPDSVFGNERVTRLLDFSQPVAVLMVAILHHVTAEEDPLGIVARYCELITPGSYLALSHMTSHDQPAAVIDDMVGIFEQVREPMVPRSREDILRFFDGLELVDPGLVAAPEWRPDTVDPAEATGLILAGVGMKP